MARYVTDDDAVELGPSAAQPVDGFEAFARANLPALIAYATVLAADREVAADVVQDVLVRAHGRWSRIGALDHPYAYVRKMVTNEYLSWRRRWHVRSVVPVDDEQLAAGAGAVADPAQRVVDGADLHQRLAGLPRRQRAVLVLRHFEGLPDPEIADLLGVAEGTVRSDASRGLATLRRRADPSTPPTTPRRRP